MSEADLREWEKYPVYIALGSNIEPETNLPDAIEKLKVIFDSISVSSAWQSPAVGFEGEDFLNAVVLVHTPLSQNTLKNEILRPLEALLGRVRTEEKFSPRTIDMDVLIYNQEIIDSEIWSQAHLALPLAELIPELMNGEDGQPLQEISKALQKTADVQVREDIKIKQIA